MLTAAMSPCLKNASNFKGPISISVRYYQCCQFYQSVIRHSSQKIGQVLAILRVLGSKTFYILAKLKFLYVKVGNTDLVLRSYQKEKEATPKMK